MFMKNKIFSRRISLLLSFMPAIAWSAIGDTFEYTAPEGVNLTFKVTSESPKTVQFGTGEKNYASIDRSYAGTIAIPTDVNGYHVTGIGAYAFYNCKSITAITIPEDVTVIGTGSFYECENLTSFNIPSGISVIASSAFRYCKSLTSINIPNSVTEIESSAFSGCI